MLTTLRELDVEILMYADIDTIASLCSTRKFSHICHDDAFWLAKLEHDGIQLPYIEEGMNWIRAYKIIKRINDIKSIATKSLNRFELFKCIIKSSTLLASWFDIMTDTEISIDNGTVENMKISNSRVKRFHEIKKDIARTYPYETVNSVEFSCGFSGKFMIVIETNEDNAYVFSYIVISNMTAFLFRAWYYGFITDIFHVANTINFTY